MMANHTRIVIFVEDIIASAGRKEKHVHLTDESLKLPWVPSQNQAVL